MDVTASLQQAEELKAEVTQQVVGQCSGASCAAASSASRQQLQDLYQEMIINDLNFAIQHNVDNDLWNTAFKQHISLMQQNTKDKKNPKRGEIQANLSMFLETASGFYLQMIHEVCCSFNMEVPGFVSSSSLGLFPLDVAVKQRDVKRPSTASCHYIMQHCLIHLGDLARYRNSHHQAQIYYQQAVAIGPSNGQPYNQLAILFQSRTDEQLATYFFYLRSMTVKHSFLGASANLNTTLARYAQDEECRQLTKKIVTIKDYNKVFCYFNSLIYLMQNIERAKDTKDCLIANMRDIFRSDMDNISWSIPVRMMFINMFNLWHLTHDGNTIIDKLSVDAKGKKACELSDIEQQFYSASLDLTIAMFASFLKLVTLKPNDRATVNCFLPACKLTLNWMLQNREVLDESEFESRVFIWPLLVKALNSLATHVDLPLSSRAPLSEDFEVQGFVPLKESLRLLQLPCSHKQVLRDEPAWVARVWRFIEIGKSLTEMKPAHIEQIGGFDEASCPISFRTNINVDSDNDEEKASRERIMAKVLSPTSASKKPRAVGTPTKDSSVQSKRVALLATTIDNYGAGDVLPDSADANEKSSRSFKNVTFEMQPPTTINRSPSPGSHSRLDIHSESDFPILDVLNSRSSNGGQVNTAPKRDSKSTNSSFSSPRLAMSFPDFPNTVQAGVTTLTPQVFSHQPVNNNQSRSVENSMMNMYNFPRVDVSHKQVAPCLPPGLAGNSMKPNVFPSANFQAPPTAFPAFRPGGEFNTGNHENQGRFPGLITQSSSRPSIETEFSHYRYMNPNDINSNPSHQKPMPNTEKITPLFQDLGNQHNVFSNNIFGSEYFSYGKDASTQKPSADISANPFNLPLFNRGLENGFHGPHLANNVQSVNPSAVQQMNVNKQLQQQHSFMSHQQHPHIPPGINNGGPQQPPPPPPPQSLQSQPPSNLFNQSQPPQRNMNGNGNTTNNLLNHQSMPVSSLFPSFFYDSKYQPNKQQQQQPFNAYPPADDSSSFLRPMENLEQRFGNYLSANSSQTHNINAIWSAPVFPATGKAQGSSGGGGLELGGFDHQTRLSRQGFPPMSESMHSSFTGGRSSTDNSFAFTAPGFELNSQQQQSLSRHYSSTGYDK